MLVNLLEHVHMSLNIGAQLLYFPLLSDDYLSTLGFRLESSRQLLYLRLLRLDLVNLLVHVHAQTVKLLVLPVSLLLQVPDLHIFVILTRDQVQNLLLLLLIILQHLVVAGLHVLVLNGNLFELFLRLFILAELQDVIVILHLLHLVRVHGHLVHCIKLFLELINVAFLCFQLFREHLDLTLLLIDLFQVPDITLYLASSHFHRQIRHQRLPKLTGSMATLILDA